MGGVTSKRKDSPIKLMKIDSKERGKYGDPIGKKICGVETDSIQLTTRLHSWQIQKIIVDTEITERRSRLGVLLITVRCLWADSLVEEIFNIIFTLSLCI